MKKFKLNINNLDCANCARKIEDSLNKNKDFKNVKVNFNTMMISYETEKNISIRINARRTAPAVLKAFFKTLRILTLSFSDAKILIIGTREPAQPTVIDIEKELTELITENVDNVKAPTYATII